VYIGVRPDHAYNAKHTLFVGDLAAHIAQIAERGLNAVERKIYENAFGRRRTATPTGMRLASVGHRQGPRPGRASRQ